MLQMLLYLTFSYRIIFGLGNEKAYNETRVNYTWEPLNAQHWPGLVPGCRMVLGEVFSHQIGTPMIE